MYCKKCGTKNTEGALYCINDGEALAIHNENVLTYQENIRYCIHCSHEAITGALYCQQCGQTLSKVKETQDTRGPNRSAQPLLGTGAKETRKFIDMFSDTNILKKLALWNGISLAVLFIISLISSSVINGFLRDSFRGDFGPMIDGVKLLSFSDIFMISHMASVEYSARALLFEGVLSTTSGLFFLLVIPAIVLIITGFLMNRHAGNNVIENLKLCLSFSIMYGLLVGIFSIFAGVSMDISDPTELLGDITVSADYPFIESMFNAIIISMIFTSIGSIFSLHNEQRSTNDQFGLSISRAILHSMIGLVLMMIAGSIYVSSNDEVTTDNLAGDVLIGTQAGGYLWNIAQFQTLKFDLIADGESVKASYSLIGGPKASEGDDDALTEFFDGFNWIWMLVLIPIALHSWAGNLFRKSSHGNILYELGVYAVTFGIVNAIMVSISKLTIDTNFDDVFTVTLGFSIIGTFIFSTLLAFGISYAAVMVTNRQTSHQAPFSS